MSDLAAAARILTALADAIDHAEDWADARHVDVRSLADWLTLDADEVEQSIAAELLAAARREVASQPREWGVRIGPHSVSENGTEANARAVAARYGGEVVSRTSGGEWEPVQPRVWLPGDEVPAGVPVAYRGGQVSGPWGLPWRTTETVIEVVVPDHTAAEAAEQARRAAGDGEATLGKSAPPQ